MEIKIANIYSEKWLHFQGMYCIITGKEMVYNFSRRQLYETDAFKSG